MTFKYVGRKGKLKRRSVGNVAPLALNIQLLVHKKYLLRKRVTELEKNIQELEAQKKKGAKKE